MKRPERTDEYGGKAHSPRSTGRYSRGSVHLALSLHRGVSTRPRSDHLWGDLLRGRFQVPVFTLAPSHTPDGHHRPPGGEELDLRGRFGPHVSIGVPNHYEESRTENQRKTRAAHVFEATRGWCQVSSWRSVTGVPPVLPPPVTLASRFVPARPTPAHPARRVPRTPARYH